jgi:hypothetical protein
MLDATWQDSLKWDSLNLKPDSQSETTFDTLWEDSLKPNSQKPNYFKDLYHPTEDDLVQVAYSSEEIDVSDHGPYANYNWELFFHIPLTIAVHLSKTHGSQKRSAGSTIFSTQPAMTRALNRKSAFGSSWLSANRT